MPTVLAMATATALVTAIAVTVARGLVREMPTGLTTAALAITRAASISMGTDLVVADFIELRTQVDMSTEEAV
jgi:hypothetical protein